jgi:hypothetical protein
MNVVIDIVDALSAVTKLKFSGKFLPCSLFALIFGN